MLSVSEILKLADQAPTKEEKIGILRKHGNQAVKDVIMGAYDDRVQWLLPEGTVPYKPSIALDQHGMLHSQARTLYLYVKGGNDNLKQTRREQLFVELLESLTPEDAELMVKVKDKAFPYLTLTPNLIVEAFPDMNIVYTPKQKPVEVGEKTVVSKSKRKPKEQIVESNDEYFAINPEDIGIREAPKKKAKKSKENVQVEKA